MARILITSGPTRQFLDPVRYLTNASSGTMGAALATAALQLGHEVVIISGPVQISYPAAATVIDVVTTEEMLQASREQFASADGLIGAAAPCDYRPVKIAPGKLQKTGEPLVLELIETDDVVATLGKDKQPHQWVVGFALETDDPHFRAITKLHKKRCDLVVINGPQAMDAATNQIEMIDPEGQVILQTAGQKQDVARAIMRLIEQRLIAAVAES